MPFRPSLQPSLVMGRESIPGDGIHYRVFLCEFVHRETCFGKESIDFVPHLETLRADARTNDGMEVLGLCAIGDFQYIDIGLDDTFLCPLPSSMDG